MKSLAPMVVGVVLGMTWVMFALQSAWFSELEDEIGFESGGLCVGGPAFVIMMLGMIVSMMLEDRK